jgi:hypothetical protein
MTKIGWLVDGEELSLSCFQKMRMKSTLSSTCQTIALTLKLWIGNVHTNLVFINVLLEKRSIHPDLALLFF